MNLKFVRGALLFVVACGLSFYVGTRYSAAGGMTTGEQLTEVNTRVMNEVLGRIKKGYLRPEDIDAKKLMYGAAEGMTASLGDPYTAFFPPTENQR